MGFLDKAKDAAKQAQQKLDETQQKFNDKQRQQPPGEPPRVEYDEHGRRIPFEQPEPFSAPPPGTPGSLSTPPPLPDGPPGQGLPPGNPAAKAAAIAPVGPRPAVTFPPGEGSSGPIDPAPEPAAAPPAEGAGEEEVIHGAPSAPPGPPPSEPMGPPPTPGQQDPSAPPRMTSGDPLGG